jgi:hypothetical protein
MTEPMPEETNQQPSNDHLRILKHFCKISEVALNDVPTEWAAIAQQLINATGLNIDELKEFMTWVVCENVSDNPKYNSVAIQSKAKDKFATFFKHYEYRLTAWKRMVTSAQKVAAATARVTTPARPLPRDIAAWLMTGPGVNQPVKGWESARQKLDEIKIAWYGTKVWKDQPDPDIDFEELFASYQQKLEKKPQY